LSSSFALTLGYRGTRYAGWAIQPRQAGPTVQATVETALAEVLGHPVRVSVAGRTDTGVHADGQVVSFATSTGIGAVGLERALRSRLPDDVWLVDARVATAGFDARHSARRRWYRYAIWNDRRSTPPAAWQGRCLVVPHALDLPAMRRAARPLVGRLDVTALASQRSAQAGWTLRTILAADWLHSPDSPLAIFEVCADAFVRGMVRSLVGSLMWVGRGRWTPEQLWSALSTRNRQAAGPAAPAHGLTLHRVDY
jgi:tRNA pseudouridine38-40 synthase